MCTFLDWECCGALIIYLWLPGSRNALAQCLCTARVVGVPASNWSLLDGNHGKKS
jgi:hypothetical protein